MEKKYKLIVWDIETTGFVAPESKITEIGALLVDNDDNITTKSWLLNNHCDIPEKITEITGITKEIIDQDGLDPETVLMEFINLVKDSGVNITHNGTKFDIPFFLDYSMDVLKLNDFEYSQFSTLINENSIDTAAIYKASKLGMQKQNESDKDFNLRVMSTFSKQKFNLGYCCDEFGIDRSNVTQHRAAGDVFLTYELYKKLVEQN